MAENYEIDVIKSEIEEFEVTERRIKQRFPLIAVARYQLCDHSSDSVAEVGKTVNLSSSGMLLRIPSALHLGQRVEVAVDLPMPQKTNGVELRVQGRVVRVEEDCVAIHFDEQELRRIPRKNSAVS